MTVQVLPSALIRPTAFTFNADGSVSITVNNIDGLRFYEANGKIRFGVPEGLNTGYPAFEFYPDTAIPTLATRNLQLFSPGDPVDFSFRNSFEDGGGAPIPRPKASIGQSIGQQWWQNYGQFSTVGVYGFGGEYKTIKPISLTGTPTFTGSYPAIGVSNYVDGRRYHFLFTQASGAIPEVALNGWASRALKRANGDTPAENFWPAGTEVTFVYATATTDFRADTQTNSDRAAGREDSRLNQGPFYARSAKVNALMDSAPTGTNRGSTLVLWSTPLGEIAERPRAWVSSAGFFVVGGRGPYEDGTSFGHQWNDAYPGELTVSAVGGTGLIPDQSNPILQFAPGPHNPINTPGWGALSVIMSNAGFGSSVAMRKSGSPDTGLDFTLTHSTDTFNLVSVSRGAVTRAISAVAEANGGNVLLTTAAHALDRVYNTVYVTGVTNLTDGVYLARYVSATQVILLGTIYSATMVAGGTLTEAARSTRGAIVLGTGVFTWNGDFWVGAGFKASRVGDEVNRINITGGATGVSPTVAALGEANLDLVLTPAGTGNIRFPGGVLLKTGAALTDGAAAQVGTITNAPTAGNPTKWVPINDNGTTRYIPVW